jgi:hypothetical protein
LEKFVAGKIRSRPGAPEPEAGEGASWEISVVSLLRI